MKKDVFLGAKALRFSVILLPRSDTWPLIAHPTLYFTSGNITSRLSTCRWKSTRRYRQAGTEVRLQSVARHLFYGTRSCARWNTCTTHFIVLIYRTFVRAQVSTIVKLFLELLFFVSTKLNGNSQTSKARKNRSNASLDDAFDKRSIIIMVTSFLFFFLRGALSIRKVHLVVTIQGLHSSITFYRISSPYDFCTSFLLFSAMVLIHSF